MLAAAQVPLLIVNRTLQTAQELAATVARRGHLAGAFRGAAAALRALVLATGGGEPVLDAATLARLGAAGAAAPLLIDFGVPPNVDPAAARAVGLTRVGHG